MKFATAADALSSPERRRLQVWFGAIAVATLLVVVIGGATRLTHSGLSIVDWRPLVGIVPPLSHTDWVASFERYQQFPEYRLLRPDMTLAEYKEIFFWEYLHRLAARAIGLVFLLPFTFFALSGTLTRSLLLRALGLFGLGALQGLAGWLMVRSGLVDHPSVSHYRLAVHLMLAITIVGVCVWLIRDLSLGNTRATVTPLARRRASQVLVLVGCMLGLQIVWGAFVAGLKAGFLFNSFPLMGDMLVPTEYMSRPIALALMQHPVGVQWVHRMLGTALLVSMFVFRRWLKADPTSERLATALLLTIGTQYAIGVVALIQVVPIRLAIVHQAMAVAIAGLWVCAVHHVRHLAVA